MTTQTAARPESNWVVTHVSHRGETAPIHSTKDGKWGYRWRFAPSSIEEVEGVANVFDLQDVFALSVDRHLSIQSRPE